MRSDSRPLPGVGDVLRYAYLWSHEHDRGREEGTKDRPCAVMMLIRRDDGTDEVAVLPITSAKPEDDGAGVEIPAATRARLGLQREPCWVVVTELNLFRWPGPDLRPFEAGEGSFVYGRLPRELLLRIREAFRVWRERGPTRAVRRTE
jgi:hypothetical protein